MTFDWKSLFSGKGRIDRTTFWTVQLLLVLFQACLQATGTLFPSEPLLVALLLFLIAAWVVSVFNMAKRLHDLGRTGWWILVPAAIAVLVVGLAAAKFGRGSNGALASEDLALLGPLVFLLVIGVRKGNAGPNRFGDPPMTLSSPAV